MGGHDRKKVYENNLEATKLAIVRTFSQRPGIDDILMKKDTARHFFYQSSIRPEPPPEE